MKIAVLTAALGTNNLIPIVPFKGVDYFAFSNTEISCPGWVVNKAIEFSSDPIFKNRRNAKIYKVLPFLFIQGYDYYIWLDSTHKLEQEPEQIIKTYLKHNDVAVFKHPERNCLYEEGRLVKELGFDHPNLIDEQLQFYRELNYPQNNGLYELPVRIQRNNEITQKMGLMWWEQICMFSSRDQISFPFVCQKLGLSLSTLPGRANTIRGNSIMPQVVSSNHNRRV